MRQVVTKQLDRSLLRLVDSESMESTMLTPGFPGRPGLYSLVMSQ